MGLLWPDSTEKKGKRQVYNPKPRIPATGWKRSNDFPDLSSAKVICFDLETKDPDINDYGPGWGRGVGHIIGIALGTDDGFKKYFPMRHEEHGDCNHNPQQVLRYVADQLSRENQPKVGHNSLYDLGWLAHEGVEVKGEVHDTWIAEKLLDHHAQASLQECGMRHLGEGKESEELYKWAWQYWGKGEAKSDKEKRDLAMSNLWRCPPELVGFYAESDVDLPIRIGEKQFPLLEETGQWNVYRMECDLLQLLVRIRLAGVTVNLDAAHEAYKQIETSINELQHRVDKMAGKPLNTGSPVEMAEFFDRLGIEYNTTENGKMSLTGEYMKSLEHPIGQMVVDLEELKKYNSTFIQNAILNSNINGKIHAEFNQMRAVTGRMSSSSPNLQQVPSRNDLAKVVRAIFIPDAGHDHWRKYDYSSIESRILAHFAVGQGARDLRKEYRDNPNTDYHNFTQAMIKRLVGLELPRKHVKNVNFAGIYGASEKKLQSMMGLTNEEADTFFQAYHDGLPYVKATMNHMSQLAEEQGYTTTILGRRASFDMWEPKYTPRGAPRPFALPFDRAVREYGPNIKRAHLHKSLNYVIQGSAADLMKAALVKCWKDGIFDRTTVPRLIVHDEVDFSVPEDYDEEAFAEMKHVMETALRFRIPIKMEGDWGPNWSELYPIQ